MSAVAAKTDQRVRVALVGAGVIGPIHGKVIGELADRIELVAVVDHKPSGPSRWPRGTAASRSPSSDRGARRPSRSTW